MKMVRLGSVAAKSTWKVYPPIASRISSRRRRKGDIFLPPTEPGSFGDEAMVKGLLSQLDRSDAQHVPMSGVGWETIIGQGDSHLPALLEPFAAPMLASRLRRAERAWVIGADVLDGHYVVTRSVRRLQFADLAARCGARTAIIGFSMNETPAAAVRTAWSRLHPSVRLVARDAISAERTQQLVARTVLCGADLAFLIASRHPALLPPGTELPGSVRVGISVNVQFDDKLGGTEAHISKLVDVVEALLATNPDLAVVLLPHDTRFNPSDFGIVRKVAEHFGDDRVLGADFVQGPAEVRWLAARMDVVVACRMHAAIGSLGEGTPAAVLGYQGKAEGMMRLFGLERYVVDPVDTISDPQSFVRVVDELLANRDELRMVIAERLPGVRAMAKSSFTD